jgi:ribosomal protein S12 methylthiotransferase
MDTHINANREGYDRPRLAVSDIAERDYHRLMAAQQRISRKRLKARVGSIQRVLVDAAGKEGAHARSFADAPEIDGIVHVAPHPSLRAGQFATVLIEASDAHDLSGRVVEAG